MSVIDEASTALIVASPLHADPVFEVCSRVEGRIINIHHSFLPSFRRQAVHQRTPRAWLSAPTAPTCAGPGRGRSSSRS